MEMRRFGNSGLQVSAVGLGCNTFGAKVDKAGAKALVTTALDLGITYFDTADVYGKGLSEEYLGAALKGHRNEVVIATKSFHSIREGAYTSGTSRKYLMEALEGCLRRLGTDFLDLYVMHGYDPHTPIEETLHTLDKMVASGKVRYIASSGYTTAQIVEADWAARANRYERLIGAMNDYSLIVPGAKKEMIPCCERYGIAFVPYFPLGRGFLTGKYRPGEPRPPDGRLAAPTEDNQAVLSERNYALLTKLEDFCAQTGRTILELAIGWLLSHPSVPSVIAGATRTDQVEQNVAAGAARLTAEEMAEVDAILEAA